MTDDTGGLVAGLVLAAGRGVRFGAATKQLAEVDGRPLVRIAVDTAVSAGLSPVVVVVGHDADAVRSVLPPGVETVHNERFAEGQSTSLAAGLRWLASTPAEACVVLLADEPGVRSASVRAVRDRLLTGAELVRCRYTDRPGHPVGMARSRWDEAGAAPGEDAGARALLRDPATVHVEIGAPAPVDVDEPDDLTDVAARGTQRHP